VANFGIDLGGTKIEGVALDSKGHTLARIRIPTEQEKGYGHIVANIVSLVRLLENESGIGATKLGIGTPGTTDPFTSLLKNSNTQCLNGKPLKLDLEKSLGIPLVMANDANCFALAEAKIGIVQDIAPQAKVVFGIIMGTGVGGGIVVNGHALYGKHGIAGEWGHNVLDEKGDLCYCGRRGCVETILAGPWLEKYYAQLSGNRLRLPEIVSLSRNSHDPHAKATMERLLQNFGKALGRIINVLDPDVIVVGGGVGNIDELYDKGIDETRKHIFNNSLSTYIVKPKLGDSAGVYGAAMLCEEQV